ncbi:MAG TPA: hypothetical protein VIK14_02510 [Ignavibacteria bacterium]
MKYRLRFTIIGYEYRLFGNSLSGKMKRKQLITMTGSGNPFDGNQTL